MTPRILEYEDGRVKVTAEAYAIPEIKALIDKYDMQVEPYLAYVHAMSAPDSPYVNVPEMDRQESVLYDVKATLGDFDYEDSLTDNAIQKLRSLYTTPMVLLAEELAEELARIRRELRNTPIIMGGMEDNFKSRMTLLEKIEKMAISYTKIREYADKDLNPDTKGDHEVGDY